MSQALAAPTRRIVILIGLFLTLVMPCIGLLRRALHIDTVPLVAQEGYWWTLLTVVLLFILAVERRGLASVGWRRPTWKTLAFGAGGAVAGLAAGVLVVSVVLPSLGLQQDAAAFKRMLAIPFWVRVAIVTRASVCEELMIRGYGIERLQELTGSRLIAGAVTLAMFAFAHLSNWGPAQILVAGAIGLPLTVLYVWRRDLVANILAHWLIDAVGVLLPG